MTTIEFGNIVKHIIKKLLKGRCKMADEKVLESEKLNEEQLEEVAGGYVKLRKTKDFSTILEF